MDEVRLLVEIEVYLFYWIFIVDLNFVYVWYVCFIFIYFDIIIGKYLIMWKLNSFLFKLFDLGFFLLNFKYVVYVNWWFYYV